LESVNIRRDINLVVLDHHTDIDKISRHLSKNTTPCHRKTNCIRPKIA